MKLEEWTATIVAELAAAGFDASTHAGFPLVKVKPSVELQERMRLLNFSPSLPAERRIYHEGMLFIPVAHA